MTIATLEFDNVNQAFVHLKSMVAHNPGAFRKVAPRGMPTMEWDGPYITVYHKPMERVLFDPGRDANPFFHFFESLWILAGRDDVAYLSYFNGNIKNYSDNGTTFHGAYGHRLRRHFMIPGGPDQIDAAIELFKADHDTRQVVLSIWDPDCDLGAKTKDMPCNDLIMLKIRNEALHITVCCRSNDAVWGAYGANVVQFSMLQEFIARAVGVKVGSYTQISDSFHIYDDNEAWNRCKNDFTDYNQYHDNFLPKVQPYPLMVDDDWKQWDNDLYVFNQHLVASIRNDSDTDILYAHMLKTLAPFFIEVALPLLRTWSVFKKSRDVVGAIEELRRCKALDWKYACFKWLERREDLT